MDLVIPYTIKVILKKIATEVIKRKFLQWLKESTSDKNIDKNIYSKINAVRLKVFKEENSKIVLLVTYSPDRFTRVYWIDKDREPKDILFSYSNNYATIFVNEDFVHNMYGLFADREDGGRSVLISQFDNGFTRFKEDMKKAWII